MDYFTITGKNALVTGASRGIGKAVALGYARSGANLILVARKMDPNLLTEIEALGVKVKFYPFDFSNPSEVPTLIQHIVSEWKQIDILVNCAGTQRRNDSVDFTEEDWDFVNDVNAKSVFLMCREVGRIMLSQGHGKIINFASLLSFQGGYRVPAYAASKGAVMQFTKSLANEWAAHGVNVNCIVPGYFDTEMNEALVADKSRNEQILVRIPANRWGKPEDIVGTAIFLASRASDYIHGICIPVDGGWLGR